MLDATERQVRVIIPAVTRRHEGVQPRAHLLFDRMDLVGAAGKPCPDHTRRPFRWKTADARDRQLERWHVQRTFQSREDASTEIGISLADEANGQMNLFGLDPGDARVRSG